MLYAAITKNPRGPAPQLANLASLNALSIRVPSTTLARCPPSCGNQSFETASNIHANPVGNVIQNMVVVLSNDPVAYAIAIHVPIIAFGCVTVAAFAFKPLASTVNMPRASNAATAIILLLYIKLLAC